MGCAPSRAQGRRSRSGYHGVAAPLLANKPAVKQKSIGSSGGTPPSHSYLSDSNDVSDFEGSIYSANAEEEERVARRRERRELRRQARREQRRLELRAQRDDALMNFGSFRLHMVDELARGRREVAASGLYGVSSTPSRQQGAGPSSRPVRQRGTFPSTVQPAQHSARFKISHCSGPRSPRRARPRAPRGPHMTNVRRYSFEALAGHRRRLKFVLLSPGGELLFSCENDSSTVLVHHLSLRCEVGRLLAHDDVVLGADVSVDGELLATASRDTTAILWDVTTCKLRLSLPHPNVVFCCCFAPQGLWLATACQDGLCRLWDLSHGIVVRSFGGHSGLVFSIAFSSDSSQILSGGSEKLISVYAADVCDEEKDTTTTAPSASRNPDGDANGTKYFAQHTAGITSIDTRYSASLEADLVLSVDGRLILLWRLDTLTCLAAFNVSLLSGEAVPASARSPMRSAVAAAARRPYWSAACFAPDPFSDHVVASTTQQNLCLLRCATAGKPCRSQSASGCSSLPSSPGDYSVGGAREAATRNTQRKKRERGKVELVIHLRSPVCVLTSTPQSMHGASGLVAVGDRCGNTYAFRME